MSDGKDSIQRIAHALVRLRSSLSSSRDVDAVIGGLQALGLEDAANELREPVISYAYRRTIAGLESLFDGTAPHGRARYSAALAFGPDMAKAEFTSPRVSRVVMEPYTSVHLRKLVLPKGLQDTALVHDIGVRRARESSTRLLLSVGSSPLEGGLFTLDGPDLLDERVAPGDRLIVTIEHPRERDVRGTFLGNEETPAWMENQRANDALPFEHEVPPSVPHDVFVEVERSFFLHRLVLPSNLMGHPVYLDEVDIGYRQLVRGPLAFDLFGLDGPLPLSVIVAKGERIHMRFRNASAATVHVIGCFLGRPI